MTNYDIKEFQTWLNEERNRELKAQGENWEVVIDVWKGIWKRVCQKVQKRRPTKENSWVLLQWIEEVNQRERERERERAK